MSEELIKGIADWLSVPVLFVALGLAASGAVWLCWRTRSPSLLLERAWRILVGSSCPADREAGALLREHQELLEVRFKHVPSLRTHRELLSLKGWLSANDEDIGDIGRCGDFFDTEQLKVRDDKFPRTWLKVLGFLILCIALWFGVAFAALSVGSKPILRLKATETWLVLDRDSVRPLFGQGTLKKSQCPQPAESADTGFSVAEHKLLCKLLDSPEAVQHFENGVPLQRFAFAMLASVLCFVAFPIYQWFRRTRAATELHQRLVRRSSAAIITQHAAATTVALRGG